MCYIKLQNLQIQNCIHNKEKESSKNRIDKLVNKMKQNLQIILNNNIQ